MKILIFTGLTYFNRSFSLAGIIKTQAQMFVENGHDVDIVVARGMANKENLDGYNVIEAIDGDNTYDNLKDLIGQYDIVFTHDIVWVQYYDWINKILDRLEDENPQVKFVHQIHSAPGNGQCPEYQKARNKPNVFYGYPNKSDLKRLSGFIGTNYAFTTKFANNVIDEMGGDENLYRKLGLFDVDYVGFYPAHLMPGKNAPAILKVVQGMKQRGMSVKFMFTANGMSNGETLDRLNSYRQLTKDMDIEDCVIWLPDYEEFRNNVEYEDIKKLWKITNLFIIPSWSETTSLMLLEAMINKCIIVANESVPVFKEICDNGAIYHKFGSHLEGNYPVSNEQADKIAELIERFYLQHHSLFSFNRVKRLYNRQAVYDSYKQVLDVKTNTGELVSVIMPIMNTCQELIDITKKAITSIRQYKNVELILINNHKEDVTDYGADISIVNDVNVGVSRAWNQGLTKAGGDWVCISNSDIEVPENWFNQMRSDGVAFPYIKDRCEGEISNFKFPDVHGCFFMARKDVFNKVGPFDERFFAYFEDADYWKRCELMGISPYRAKITINHLMNATSGKMDNLGQLIEESGKKFEQKWGNQ